ncbi:hypothetical protein [Lutibacter sp.]
MKVFIEEQKFTQSIFIGLLIALIVTGVLIITEWETTLQSSLGKQLGALSGVILVLLVILLFANLKLKTRIDENGISYKFYPFHKSYKIISWNTISNSYIRNYDAISEYGGWGIKFSFRKKKGKSFTTKGNIGLQIELKNGSKILIGTQKKEELQRVLNTYQYKIITNEV